MQLPLWDGNPRFRDNNGAMIASLSNYPLIRFSCMAKRDFSTKPRTDYPMTWEAIRPDNAGRLSATAFYYGVELYRSLDIPIGLIISHGGGTRKEL